MRTLCLYYTRTNKTKEIMETLPKSSVLMWLNTQMARTKENDYIKESNAFAETLV